MSLLNLQRLVLHVSDPVAAAAWYRKHLGLKDSEPAREDARSVCLVTPSRVVLIELWAESPGQEARRRFRRHFQQRLAVHVANPLYDAFRLFFAGATKPRRSPDGLVLKDPFGLELLVSGAPAATAA